MALPWLMIADPFPSGALRTGSANGLAPVPARLHPAPRLPDQRPALSTDSPAATDRQKVPDFIVARTSGRCFLSKPSAKIFFQSGIPKNLLSLQPLIGFKIDPALKPRLSNFF